MVFRAQNWMRLAIFLAAVAWLSGTVGPLSAQICVYVDTYDYAERLSANQVRAHVGSSLSGACAAFWYPGVQGFLYNDDQEIAAGDFAWGPLGGDVGYDVATVGPSQWGPGTYTSYGYHWIYCPATYCGVDSYEPPYGDGWDGWEYGDLEVRRPTISGFFNNNSFWNLGPGSADPQATLDGSQYFQSVQLTFNSNCNPGDHCSGTPQWSLITENNQAVLTSNSGTTTFITKGNDLGNCQYDSAVSVSLGGFSSDLYDVAVNSQKSLLHTNEGTRPYNGGYLTLWYFEVTDACSPANFVKAIPMNETFFSGFSAQNGSSGWITPIASHWGLENWADLFSFPDMIAQWGTIQNPTPTYTKNASPYIYNTVLLSGSHLFFGGTATNGSGIHVYTGTLRYYRDHGDNTP